MGDSDTYSVAHPYSAHGSRARFVTFLGAKANDTDVQWLIKRTISAHDSAAMEQACRYANEMAVILQREYDSNGAGSLGRISFPTYFPMRDGKFVLDLHNSEKPERYVCAPMITDTLNLKQAVDGGFIKSPQGARLHMARALAILHSRLATDTVLSSNSACTHYWHGSVSLRLQRAIEHLRSNLQHTDFDELTTDDHIAVVANLEILCDSLQRRINKVPKYPVTTDLQSKNFVINLRTEAITIVNVEILWSSSRLWDLLYLLLIDDNCTGIFKGNSGSDICRSVLTDFSSAIGVYLAHTGGGEKYAFTAEEIEIFPLICQVKLAQVAFNEAVRADDPCISMRNYKLLHLMTHHAEWSQELRSVLRGTGTARLPDLPIVLQDGCSFKHVPFGICLDRIQNGDPTKTTKALVYFNGTYAPFHAGHLEAAASVAKLIEEKNLDCEVVGVAISPCMQSHLQNKLKGQTGFTYADIHRIALIDMALSCGTVPAAPAAIFANELRSYNAFVDTTECIHHEAGDMNRYDTFVDRFKVALAEAGRGGSKTIGKDYCYKPLIVFVAGSDVENFLLKKVLNHGGNRWKKEPIVQGVVVSRFQGDEHILDSHYESVPVHVATQNLQVSSSAIRSSVGSCKCDALIGIPTISYWVAHNSGEASRSS